MILDPQRIEDLKTLCIQTNQPALFKKMIRQFIQSLNESQAEIEALVKANIDRSLHTLKGRCGTIGAVALARAVENAEEAPPEQFEDQLAIVRVLIGQSIDALIVLLEE